MRPGGVFIGLSGFRRFIGGVGSIGGVGVCFGSVRSSALVGSLLWRRSHVGSVFSVVRTLEICTFRFSISS